MSFFDWIKGFFTGGAREPITGEEVGIVTHYFPKSKACVIKIRKGKITVGDTLLFRGHTTNFKQKIDSLQVDHKPIQEAGKGKEIAAQVRAKVRSNDIVYKI